MSKPIKKRILAIAALAAAAGIHTSAQSAITCSVSATNINASYVPTNAAALLVTGSYTVNCMRAAGDAGSISYDLSANNGANPTTGSNNRIRLGTSTFYYNYELYRSATISNANRWQIANNRRFTGVITFTGTALNATSGAQTFWLNILPQTEDPAGTYTDTVTMTLAENVAGSPFLNSGTFDVNITTDKRCVFTSTPATLDFNYTSFQNTVSNATPSAFQVRCTRNATYSVALDATSGTLLGLNYNLTLTTPASLVGNSANQNFSVSGNIPANQVGTCNTGTCTATQARTLTITY
jgi:spore coat protein U-like protein